MQARRLRITRTGIAALVVGQMMMSGLAYSQVHHSAAPRPRLITKG
jgi:hypothetical protein